MPAIPKVYRQRLASSAVGTPGIDSSGASIAESLGGMANTAANILFHEAQQKQSLLDQAETNRLLVQHKTNAINLLERHKKDYAENPEASAENFKQGLQDSLDSIKEQATNPRVRDALSLGDPAFDARMTLDQGQWALNQRERIDKRDLVDNANQLALQANKIALDGSASYDEKKAQLLPIFSAVGNLSAGAFALAHPDAAVEFQQKVPLSIIKGTVYGMISSNPAQALAFLQEKEVQNILSGQDINTLQTAATAKMKDFAKNQEWFNLSQSMADSPKLVADVLSGKTDWSQLDQMPQNKLVQELKKISLETYPKSVQEEQKSLTDFYSEAAKIGLGVRKNPPERSVADLVKFNEDLATAFSSGLITKGSYQMMNKQLSGPLVQAVMKAHDPFFGKAGNLLMKWQGGTPEPQDVVDKYVGGYNVINKYLASIGKADDYHARADLISDYLKMTDKLTPDSRDENNRPYTAHTIAQSLIGIKKGDMLQTPFGPRSITGHDENGLPTITLTPEEQKRFDHLRDLKLTKTKSKEE